MITLAQDPQEIFAIHPQFRLRNDRKYVIAANLDENRGYNGVLRLTPVEGVLLSLFDGKRTLREVPDISTAFFPENTDHAEYQATKLVEQILGMYTEPHEPISVPVLIREKEIPFEKKHLIQRCQPKEFIVKSEAYCPGDLKLAFPISILWLVTNRCSVKCQYCYMHRPELRQDEHLPWERVRELIYEAHREGTMEITLSGGDPLCYPHLFEFLDLLEELGFPPMDLPTKTYVSVETAKRLAKYRILRSLQFSIDSTVPEVADFIVQSPGFCEKTLESIRNALNAGIIAIHTKSVITPYTLPTLPKLYRDMKALNVKKIMMATYCRSGYWHKEKLFNHTDDYQWLDREILKLRQEFPDDDIQYQNGSPSMTPLTVEQRAGRWPNRNRCTAGRERLTICANGKVVACEQMPEREEDYVGDLRVQSIREVWESEKLDRYLVHPPRDRFRGTVCYDCDEFTHCQSVLGTCVRDSCIHYGTRWAPVPNCPRASASRTM